VEGRRALFNNLFREVKAILNSSWDDEKQEGVPPSAWKVVVAFTHGDAKGGVTMHPDAWNEDAHWGVASQWWTPFYSVGVRRLHYHTCHVGRYFANPVMLKYLKGNKDIFYFIDTLLWSFSYSLNPRLLLEKLQF